ncbi:putative disease resistance protein At4g19050 isoform X2 [Rhododendron vialii]|uniref:putative disease resistance protein At4g19050 isoform X2 n=1 Tax=Rhododendron vialii TaxID=182163 RepID=UPI00265DA481|nr:putative disease resistance protein At4g19050 isoform X2 [Rhododendron vialii]XP_058207615.1 putative disease resistance protein At4g19050 isoform X2 [Rhododendron vialii]
MAQDGSQLSINLTSTMASTVVQRKEAIFKLLSDERVKKITLTGDSGVGKTWTAKLVSVDAKKEGLFEIVLWVFLDSKYNEAAVRESIARQLSLLPLADEWDGGDDVKEAKKVKKNENIQEMIAKSVARKRLLLILDYKGKNKMDVEQKTLELESPPIAEEIASESEDLILDDKGMKLNEEQILSNLETMLNLDSQSSYKVIITRVNASTGTEGVIRVEPLLEKESLFLLEKRVGGGVHHVPAIKSLGEAFIQKTKHMPGSIILMAKTFSYFIQHGCGVGMLKRALEEASTEECYNLNQLLCNGYDLVLPRSIIIDYCRQQSHFFLGHGKSIYYNELIAYWILEGYLGHVDCLEKAYEKGHSILIELVDCQVLRNLEGGFVTVGSGTNRLEDLDRYGFGGRASLGLADLFTVGDWEGFGRLTYIDGMVKSICKGIKGLKLSTLFLAGCHCWEILDCFYPSKQELREELQVLAIFNPTFESLPQLLNDLHELVVLVLRSCDFLVKIDNKFDFKNLTVLEISNASSLKKIPNDFFDLMPKLESLHLSELKLNPLPLSIYNLTELRWLILRGCSCFQTLNSLKNFKKLLVLDVSGATALTKFEDKAFNHTPLLQTLNLSLTSITLVPKFSDLKELTHFSLSGCKHLGRFRRTHSLPSLQVLDLSGAINFKEFHELSPGLPTSIKILDLSETRLQDLPSSMNPRHLFLKRCSEIQKLTCTETLQNLEVFDLSGTTSLVEIEDKFFSKLDSLQILNLSETSIQSLPSLSNVSDLHQLFLSGCKSLTEIKDESFEHMSCLEHLDLSETRIKFLPSLLNLGNLSMLSLKGCTQLEKIPALETLSNLEELNLCGINCLKEMGAGFLLQMSQLRILDLSETQVVELPSMSNLKSLRQLYLRGCQGLQKVPNLEELTTLEVLDLSGTAITCLPRMDSFTNLRKLLLTGCPNLEEFLQMEMLDLLGAKVDQLPYGISNLTNLEFLDIPNMKNTQAAGRNTDLPQEGLEPYQWGISSFENPSTSVSSKLFVQFLEKNPSISETSFTRFHLCVCPTEGEKESRSTYFYSKECVLRDIRFQAAEFCHFKEQRSLEIRGFDLFPKGIEDVLSIVDCIFFVNSTFVKCLSDIGVSSLKAMTGCWIEGCTEMVGVFDTGKEDDIAELGTKLQFLGVSNAINLQTTHGGRAFQNLTCLYLDCCPKLSTLFSSSQLPENLRVLHVRFCDKLVSIFDIEEKSPEPELRNLEKLYLWELPEFKRIECGLPSLQTLTVWECPKLQKLEDTIRFAESLQTLCISNVVDLKSINTGSEHLDTLILESCPKLKSVLSSNQRPQSLKTLKIRSCNELKTVFGDSR